MVNGWIILDKPLGLGSTQAVAAVKRNLRAAGYGKVKVGHGGTLDPLATGVLPIAVGEATKLCGRMLDASKVYAFTTCYGIETDTLDLEGKVVQDVGSLSGILDDADVEDVLAEFIGPIEQTPPAYSAIKVDGKRAYDLARAGEEVALKSRQVTVHSLDYQGSWWDAGKLYATLEAHVSKGTYIRSLARDIARALGTVGHVTMLRRLKAGPFAIDQAISLDKLNEVGQGAALEHILLPLQAGLVDIPALNLDPEQARAVRQGRVLAGLPHDDGLYWAKAGHVPLALVELEGGNLKVSRGFNITDVAE
ncbi:MAG: tRNA pseudouridine(55) synthase TruB [Novosphingobium sp.]|nr:tRNA pseudouridine(55) synthase TruB [Novosphingobium sp.]